MLEAQRKKLEEASKVAATPKNETNNIEKQVTSLEENQTPIEEHSGMEESSHKETPVIQQKEESTIQQAEKPLPKAQYIPNQNPNTELFNSPSKQKLDNYTYIPSQDNVLQKPITPGQNKYIPSQQAANISYNFDNSGLENALQRADRAEAKALQVLSGNFN